MNVERTADAATFLDAAAGALLRREARHNLMLGVADTAARHPAVYPEFRGWIVRDGADVVGTAIQTPPFSVIVGAPARPGVLTTLVDAIGDDSRAFDDDSAGIGGVTGALPEVQETADAWSERTGDSQSVRVRSGVFELTDVAPVPRAPGTPRRAVTGDQDLLVRWLTRFAGDVGDAGSPPMRDPDRIAKNVAIRLASDDSGFWFWTLPDVPVSLAGYSAPTGTGIRVGPVYTPREHRGNGYATALVADMSGWLLSSGYRACFLYTDLANRTSNAIYERIGYRKVCEALDITLTPRAPGQAPGDS